MSKAAAFTLLFAAAPTLRLVARLGVGYDQIDKIIHAVRKVRRQNVEAVCGIFRDPFLELVGNLRRRAPEAAMSACP